MHLPGNKLIHSSKCMQGQADAKAKKKKKKKKENGLWEL